MMGTKVRTFSALPHDLSLEDLVPDENFYRRLETRLDFSFVRELVAPLYVNGGRPSVDPIVFFKHGQPDRAIVRHGYRRKSDYLLSLTDPDAALMQYKRGASRLGYHAHYYVVDGGKARVILSALVTPADVMESQPMLDLLFGTMFRWGVRTRRVTGDATYGTRENIAAIEKASIRAYTALAEQGKRTSLFTIEDFVYDAQKDFYTCPAGETLRRQGYDRRDGYVRYAVRTSACEGCKSKCTNSPKGRWISRSLEEKYLERVRAYRETEAYRKALRKRAVWVEPLFGEAKQWHGFWRFRLRRLEKVNSAALMTASGQNVKRLLAFGSKGPRRPAQVATLRRPEAGRCGFHEVRGHRESRQWGPPRPFSTGCHLPRTWVNRLV